MKSLAAALAVAAAANAFALPPPSLPCRNDDKECANRERVKSPVKQIGFWKPWLDKPAFERNGAAPDELLVFLGLDNMASGYSERPRPAAMPADLKADFDAAVRSIPERIWGAVDKRLVGVFFLEDLGGTAMCDYVSGGWFARERGFIVLDMAVLSRHKANEWATWKENTPFKPAPGTRLEAQIEDAAGNTRANAIRYILLHEMGHILSIGTDILPRWDQLPPNPEDMDRFAFAHLSWRVKADRSGYQSVFDDAMPQRKDVVYYFGARLDGGSIAPLYRQLAQTSFPTLYAATHPGDDFAESFASYVHSVLDKRPWEIRIRVDGQEDLTYRSCWNEPRCADKRKMVESMLAR